jgi:hypothetical protein
MLRIFALILALVGLAFIVSGIPLFAGVLYDPDPGSSPGQSVLFVLVGTASLVVGVAMMRRRPFRPDLGDVSWWAGRGGGYNSATARGTEPRSWWTGDPKTRVRDV